MGKTKCGPEDQGPQASEGIWERKEVIVGKVIDSLSLLGDTWRGRPLRLGDIQRQQKDPAMDPARPSLPLLHNPPPLHGDPMEASPSLFSCPSPPPTQHGEKKGGSLHPQRDQGSHYSKGVSQTSSISSIRSLLQMPPLARPRPAESECSLLQMPRRTLEAEETCSRARALQAEGEA